VEKASLLFRWSGRGIYAHGLYNKGLPQGSVLSTFMYNFYTRLVEACLHPLCSILQYADDLVVYTSGKHVEAVKDSLQTSLTRLMTCFGDLGLILSANK
jgi:hypothetical protein